MSDAGERTPQEHLLTGSASLEIGGNPADLGEQSVITDSQSSGLQTFSVEQTKLAQKAEADAHRRYMETERLKSEETQKQHERRKDWIIFCILGALGGYITGSKTS